MADVFPLRAIRYPSKDQSALVAPPYDILDAPEKAALLARDRRNIVAVDLPHTPPKQAGPDAEYAAAAETFRSWLADGTLVQDERPSIYVYHQRATIDGRDYLRKMFFARLRLEEFGSGNVYPHEQTFGGPKEDRLKLTRATRCNLSPIFGLYSDAANEISTALDRAAASDPHVVARADSVENRLWCVTDAATIDRVRSAMLPRPVYIADGHHRYGTALNYRAEVAAGAAGPGLAADHPANFVLTVFCAMEDAGAIILPTHRVLIDAPGLGERLRDALSVQFEWSAQKITDPAAVAAQIAANGPQAIGVFDGATDSFAVIRPKNTDLLATVEPRRAPAWRQLPYAILHRYVLDEVVTPRLCNGKPPTIHYIKPLADALAEARQTRGAAFIMQPCAMAELRAICQAGELMPQKTTYFYPKLATGLVINPIY